MTAHDLPRSTDHDITVTVPRQWVTRSAPERGIVLAARARVVPASGFPPGLVLQVAPEDTDTIDALRAQLLDFEVEESDTFELDGRPVRYLRFSHRVGDTDVLCDQWQWTVDGTGVTLTGSVARTDWPDYCDLLEEVAATVEISAARRAA
jgi:hypothetical protein